MSAQVFVSGIERRHSAYDLSDKPGLHKVDRPNNATVTSGKLYVKCDECGTKNRVQGSDGYISCINCNGDLNFSRAFTTSNVDSWIRNAHTTVDEVKDSHTPSLQTKENNEADTNESQTRASSSDAGNQITISYAEERYTPRPYCSFGIGPFEVSSVVRDGETTDAAIRRLRDVLHNLADREFEEKSKRFLERLFKLNIGVREE